MFARSPVSALLASLLLGSAMSAQAQNLIVNGDFSAGNASFGSEYIYTPGNMSGEGRYGVSADPRAHHNDWILQSAINSTYPGASGGNLLIANGKGDPDSVWFQTVTVEPNRSYLFSGWVTSVLGYRDGNAANLSISVDLTGACNATPQATGGSLTLANSLTTVGELRVNMGTPPQILQTPSGTWDNGTATFNSADSTEICLTLLNNQLAAGGNDFAIDDLTLTLNPDAPVAGNDTETTLVDTPIDELNVLGNDNANGTANLPEAASTIDLDPSTSGVQSSITVTGGTFTVNANGTVRFVPDAGFTGPVEVVPYQVIDSEGNLSNIANITITVNAAPPTPGTVAPVPTMSDAGLALLSMMMGVGVLAHRRRKSKG